MNKNDYRVEKKFVITPIEMQYTFTKVTLTHNTKMCAGSQPI